MSKEAMKLALEALKNSIDLVSNEAREAESLYGKYQSRLARVQGLVALEVAHQASIKALEEALKQEQSEPVAWQWLNTAHFRKKLPKDAEKGAWNPLYTTPQPSQKPLTDEQIDIAIRDDGDILLDHIYEYGTAAEGVTERLRAIARAAIETAHGIKE